MNELQRTKEWFEIAIPDPTLESACVQIGCHFEEVAEMFEALGMGQHAHDMHKTASMFKSKGRIAMEVTKKVNKLDLADSMGDQQVTATGVMHMFEIDSIGVLSEINRSNFSKFEDGKPVFNEQGKIPKGKNYTPPQLDKFINK